jgi:hypothetical protein
VIAVSSVRPAAGGGIWVGVAPERLERWCAGFAQRHGAYTASAPISAGASDADPRSAPAAVVLTAADGASAECFAPFGAPPPRRPASQGAANSPDADLVAALAEYADVPRTVGIVLARRGGFAVGLVEGGRLTGRKVGSRHVQGKTKAGGWSQQRFARRREGQARVAFEAAAGAVALILLPRAADLDEVAAGGDADALKALRAEPRLAPVWAKASPHAPALTVNGDPRAADLESAWQQARSVRIRVLEPGPESEPGPGSGLEAGGA